MAKTGRWFGVSIAFSVLHLMVLYLWWNYGPPSPVDPVLAARGIGSLGWVAMQALVGGVVTLIVTALVRWALPPITWREVGLIAVAAVVAEVIGSYSRYLAMGPNTTNGAEILWTGGVYAVVLLVSGVWMRRRRRHGADTQLRASGS